MWSIRRIIDFGEKHPVLSLAALLDLFIKRFEKSSLNVIKFEF